MTKSGKHKYLKKKVEGKFTTKYEGIGKQMRAKLEFKRMFENLISGIKHGLLSWYIS